ncbi:MAG: hypothetical protein AB1428_10345 [Bacteroidota bacterium]
MRKVRIIAGYLLAGLSLFVLLVGAFTQTQAFRNWLRSTALTGLDSLLTADVRMGEIHGNLLTGFSIDSLSIDVDGRPLLRMDQLYIAYNPLSLPGKAIAIRSMTLVHPEIFLYRPAGGEWNVASMIRSQPRDTSTGPFTWTVALDRFEIRDGMIALLDSAGLAEAGHADVDGKSFEYHSFTLKDVDLLLAARLSRLEQRATIRACSFESETPPFRLKTLSGVFSLAPGEIRADSVRIVTGGSNLALNASMRDVDLAAGVDLPDLRFAPVDLTLRTHPIDLDELSELLPAVDFLTGPVALDLRATGQFGDLTVRQLDLRTGLSTLYMRGGVANLHDPERLLLDVKVSESTIVPADIPALMPRFGIPDMTPIGSTTLNLEFEGIPLDFSTKFMLETGAGQVQSSGLRLTIGGPSALAYDGEIRMMGLNLAPLLGDNRLTSSLNGTLRLKGKGVGVHQLSSSLTVQLDSSSFRDLPVEQTALSLIAGRKQFAFDGTIGLGEMRADLQGTLTEPDRKAPAFQLSGSVTSLNLEDILHDPAYNSDITMRISADGTGLSWGELNGTLAVDLSSSRYRDYEVTQGDVHLTVDQGDSLNKKLIVRSNIADLTLSGGFDLKYLVRLLPYEAEHLRAALGERIAPIDSGLLAGVDRDDLAAQERALTERPSRLDARYVLRVKDLEPISAAAGERTFNGSGLLTGMIRGDVNELSLTGDLSVDEFFYGTADAGVLIEEGRASLDIRSLRPQRPLNALTLHLETTAGRVLVNRNTVDSLDLTLDYRDEEAEFGGGGVINGDYRVRTTGSARVDESSVTTMLHSLELGYQDIRWHADAGAAFRVNHVGAGVSGLVMRCDSQTVSLEASVGQGRTIRAKVDGRHLTMDDLKYLLTDEELGPHGQAFDGGASFHASADGTLDDPVFNATIAAENVSFRTLPFGSVVGAFRYEDELLSSHVRVNGIGERPEAPPVMTIEGTVPLDLRLRAMAERVPDAPMNLRISSRGVQINVLDPLLPTFNQLSGVFSCDLTLSGTLRHPAYDGTFSLAQCGFLFVPNNIYYTLDGTFHPSAERISLADCVIRNVPEDKRSGRVGMVKLRGDFSLRDLTPGDFNLSAEGQLLVVKEATQKSALEVYGDLFVEIGPGPLRFTGEVENSLLKGSLLIRNSTLIFPPTQSTVALESPRSVPVRVIDDTLTTVVQTERSSVARYFGSGQTAAAQAEAELKKSKSFTDGLHYDLEIETGGGNSEIRMIFNPATSEELVAALDGRFNIAGDGRRWTGDLTIERAYYNFFKRFDATGTIRFTGDLMDPELNIEATYKGMRTLTDSTAAARQEPVVVTVKITGSRYEPKVDISMTVDDVDYYAYKGLKSNDVQSDAIQFIVAGTFPLTTTTQKTDLASEVRATAGLSLLTGATSLLTGRLSEFLRTQTSFISSVELSYGGKESTELRLSGTAWSGYWRYGGTILNDPLNNANISILYSFGTIFNNPSLRNLMFELERRVEPGTLGQTNDLKRINSARLFYRISF